VAKISKIVDEVIEQLREEIHDFSKIKVKDVCLGLGYSGVRLDSDIVGICHTPSSEMAYGCCQIIKEAGTLAGREVTEYMEMTKSFDLIERCIGIATINALSLIIIEKNPERYTLEEENLIDVIEISPRDVVALVGLIKPFVPIIESKARKLYIIERRPINGSNIIPDTLCEEIIPTADIVLITGSALANGTIDHLLKLSKNSRTKAIVGPSMSCIPDPFFRKGVDFTAGMKIQNPEMAMQIIKEGGGTPQLKKTGKLVTFRNK
jgi:uncharacterized protein (DUF4213/DUF364 family)